MEKVFGATERHDQLIVFGTNRAVLIYGYGEEDGQGYDYRHSFYHTPTKEEVRNVLIDHINAMTDHKILTGFVWNGKSVWLSDENQRNFSEAQRVAMITEGQSLPMTFKLGEDSEGSPFYYEFTTIEELTGFYLSAVGFIQQTLGEGWIEKDSIDLTTFGYE
jgi:hypothetical protein